MRSGRPGPASGKDSLGRRVASAGVALPLLLALVWLGPLWLITATVGLATAVGVLEYYRLLRAKGVRLLVAPGLLWALLFIADGHRGGRWAALLIVGGALALLVPYLPPLGRAGLAKLLRKPPSPPDRGGDAPPRGPPKSEWRYSYLKGWLLSVSGPLYLGFTLSHAVLLRQLEQGAQWLAVALFIAFGTDTAAYVVGRAIGRHRLAPRISPGKSWEGAAAGFLAGVATGGLAGSLLGLPLALWKALLLGAAVSLVAQVGDLLESALKRYAGAKEAGRLVPGHGGLLDRLDSVVPSLVLVYYGAIWVLP